MSKIRPYFQGFDGTADEVPLQVDSPQNLAFAAVAGTNYRTILGADGNSYVVMDMGVTTRGMKNVIWSSEGYVTPLGVTVNALTAAQKKATGNQATNIGGTAILDFSPYKTVGIMINVSTFTGGTSIQFELDYLDDSASAVNLALWKPAALTGTGAYFTSIGPGMAFAEAATAPATASTGFNAITVPSGWTYTSIPLALMPNAQFAWTIVGTFTALAWTAWIYGMN